MYTVIRDLKTGKLIKIIDMYLEEIRYDYSNFTNLSERNNTISYTEEENSLFNARDRLETELRWSQPSMFTSPSVYEEDVIRRKQEDMTGLERQIVEVNRRYLKKELDFKKTFMEKIKNGRFKLISSALTEDKASEVYLERGIK